MLDVDVKSPQIKEKAKNVMEGVKKGIPALRLRVELKIFNFTDHSSI